MRGFILSVIVFAVTIIAIFSAINFFAFPIKFRREIRAAAREFHLNASLVAAVIKVESNFRPDATSRSGARGLMQIMPATADYIAEKMPLDAFDLAAPGENIRMGAFYLRYLFDKFGDTRTVLIAYNAGEGNVVRWLDGGKKLKKCPFAETNAYVEKVLNAQNYYALRI
jgi:soluble lytic murein transglycosylase